MNALMTSKRAPKRDLFAELSEGMTALAEARQGKRTLRTHAVEFKPAPEVTAREHPHAGELGAGAREAQRSGSLAHQSGEAVSGHRRKACRHLMGRKTPGAPTTDWLCLRCALL